ncbi:MAG: hypothetical protein ACI90V_008500 [Bacillariaceae sp.]|jgi:hypothetical protein
MAKGNDGKAARQRTTKKLFIAAICALTLVFGVVYFSENGGNNVKPYGSSATKTFEKTLPKHNTNIDGTINDDDKVENGSRHKHHHNLNDRMKKHNHGNDDGAPGSKMNHIRNKALENGGKIHVGHRPIHGGDDGGDDGDDEEETDDNNKDQYDRKARHHVDGGRGGGGGRGGRGHGGRGDRPQNWGGRPQADDEEEEESLQHRKVHDGNREGGPAVHNKHHNKKDHRRVHERGGGGDGDDHISHGHGHGHGHGGDHMIHNRHVSPGDDEEEPDTDDKNNKNNGDDGEERNHEEENQEEVQQQKKKKKNIDNDIDNELAETYFNELAGPSANSRQKRFIETLLNGSMNLVGIQGTPIVSEDGSYDGVWGSFCQVNFAVHKEDPSSCTYSYLCFFMIDSFIIQMRYSVIIVLYLFIFLIIYLSYSLVYVFNLNLFTFKQILCFVSWKLRHPVAKTQRGSILKRLPI